MRATSSFSSLSLLLLLFLGVALAHPLPPPPLSDSPYLPQPSSHSPARRDVRYFPNTVVSACGKKMEPQFPRVTVTSLHQESSMIVQMHDVPDTVPIEFVRVFEGGDAESSLEDTVFWPSHHSKKMRAIEDPSSVLVQVPINGSHWVIVTLTLHRDFIQPLVPQDIFALAFNTHDLKEKRMISEVVACQESMFSACLGIVGGYTVSMSVLEEERSESPPSFFSSPRSNGRFSQSFDAMQSSLNTILKEKNVPPEPEGEEEESDESINCDEKSESSSSPDDTNEDEKDKNNPTSSSQVCSNKKKPKNNKNKHQQPPKPIVSYFGNEDDNNSTSSPPAILHVGDFVEFALRERPLPMVKSFQRLPLSGNEIFVLRLWESGEMLAQYDMLWDPKEVMFTASHVELVLPGEYEAEVILLFQNREDFLRPDRYDTDPEEVFDAFCGEPIATRKFRVSELCRSGNAKGKYRKKSYPICEMFDQCPFSDFPEGGLPLKAPYIERPAFLYPHPRLRQWDEMGFSWSSLSGCHFHRYSSIEVEEHFIARNWSEMVIMGDSRERSLAWHLGLVFGSNNETKINRIVKHAFNGLHSIEVASGKDIRFIAAEVRSHLHLESNWTRTDYESCWQQLIAACLFELQRLEICEPEKKGAVVVGLPLFELRNVIGERTKFEMMKLFRKIQEACPHHKVYALNLIAIHDDLILSKRMLEVPRSTIPEGHETGKSFGSFIWVQNHLRHSLGRRLWEQAAREVGVEMIDVFQVTSGRPDFSFDGVHPTPSMNELLGQILWNSMFNTDLAKKRIMSEEKGEMK